MSPGRFQIPRPLLVFYILVIYVFFQFTWWSYLLFDLNDQVIFLNARIDEATGNKPDQSLITSLLSQKRWMILGESLVFLCLLTLGVLQTRKSFRRESNLVRQQQNFLLSVTHELKTPLASIRLFLQTLFKRDLPRNKQIELAAKALDESNRLDNLINNILLINRMESPEFSLHIEDADISKLTDEVTGYFINNRMPSGIELLVSAGQAVRAKVDSLAFRSILENLLENAIKYAASGKSIQVEVINDRTEALLRVTDQGPGIADAEKSAVFSRFYRSGREETRNTKGTGLGLFIIRNLTNAMGGRIFLKDNQPSGCIFEVHFKKAV
jgi:signal transduction histidine kinase